MESSSERPNRALSSMLWTFITPSFVDYIRYEETMSTRLPIIEKFVELLHAWEIQILVLGSLLVQIFLIFLAPYRKQVKSTFMRFPIWAFYLLADAIPIYTLGNLSRSLGNDRSCSTSTSSGKILALWAPFLLLHLGGPDTITAFALEDNELWLRHLIGLLLQTLLASYVVFLSLPNPLLLPTLLMFMAGIIKYAERTLALYLASGDGFRASLHYDPYFRDLDVQQETISSGGNKYLADAELVKRAYSLFNVFKCLIVDLILTYDVLGKSRDFFLKLGPERALRVIEMELNFLYGALYTKEAVGHTRWGYLLRFICSCSILAALFVFLLSKKHEIKAVDITITYILFASAVGLDLLALTMLVFSDYTLALLPNTHPVLQSLVARLVARLRRRSWSDKIPQFNLIGICLNLPAPNERMSPCLHNCMELTGKLAERLGLKEMLDRLRYGHYKPVPEEVKLNDFIFRELEQRFDYAEYMIPSDRPLSMKEVLMRFKGVFELRGEWALTGEQLPNLSGERGKETLRGLLWSVKDPVEFDESLLLWHIATDLCIYKELDPLNYMEENHHEPASSPLPHRRLQKLCKLLSDYMLYQLVMQPQMMSTVMAGGIGSVHYEDTIVHAKSAFVTLVALQRLDQESQGQPSSSNGRLPDGVRLKLLNEWGEQWVEEYERKWNACGSLREWHPEEYVPMPGKSVLPNACRLAGKLMELDVENRWLVIGKVWAELLTYAASHCSGVSHAKQLSRGGELLTSVWFLMSHLGITREARIGM